MSNETIQLVLLFLKHMHSLLVHHCCLRVCSLRSSSAGRIVLTNLNIGIKDLILLDIKACVKCTYLKDLPCSQRWDVLHCHRSHRQCQGWCSSPQGTPTSCGWWPHSFGTWESKFKILNFLIGVAEFDKPGVKFAQGSIQHLRQQVKTNRNNQNLFALHVHIARVNS